MEKYTGYAKALNASDEVLNWINTNLSNYLNKYNGKDGSKNLENQTEIEHIIDYLVSDEAPKRLKKMSYEEAKKNTDKWNKSLIKKGNEIQELENDIEIIKDFEDGFKIVKLVGENAFKREGYLMRHCVASYFGKDTKVYSLRDDKNMPHCTMEENQQIKGKGNGSINPNYIKYIVAFLEEIGMSVGDNEMKNLGYINVEDLKSDFDFGKLYNDKYFYKNNIEKLENKDDVRLWSILDVFEFDLNLKIKYNFNISNSISNFKNYIIRNRDENIEDYSQLASGYNSQLAGGNNSQLAGGYNSKLAGGYNSQLAGGYNSQLAGGNNSQLAGGNNSQLAGGYNSQLAGGYNSQLAGGNNSQLAGGNNSQLAGGNNSQLAGGNYSQLAGGYNSQLAGGYNSQLAGGYNSQLAGGNNSQLAGGNYSQLAGGNNSQLAGGNYSQLAGGYNSQLAGGNNSKLAGGYNSKLAGGYNSKLAGGNNSQLAGGNNSQLASGYNSKLAGGNNSQLAGGNNSKLAGGYNSKLAGGYNSQLAGGDNSVLVGDNGSKASAGKGSIIVLVERDNNYKIISHKSGVIDGKTLKADTYYKLKNGEFVECD